MKRRNNRADKYIATLESKLSKRIDHALMPLSQWFAEARVNVLSTISGGKSSRDETDAKRTGAVASATRSGDVAIEINGLTKIYGSYPDGALEHLRRGESKEEILAETKCVVGLRNVDLKIFRGETFVIMGLSGCGKSTLERCINRLIEPTEGEVIVDGIDITSLDEGDLREYRRHHVGMVFQNFGLLPHRSVLENVAFGLEIQGIRRESRYEEAKKAIQLVGLQGYESALPAALSGGMKQRVGLARALANNPDILLMDEAFSALDPLIRKNMHDELLELQSRLHKTIVFVTHDLDEALKLGDRIAIMRNGGIIQVGTPEEILTNPADAYVSSFLEGIDRSRVLTCENVMKAPEMVISVKAGPRTALKMLRDAGQTTAFVVDAGKKLIGMVRAEDLLNAISSGRSLGEATSTDIRTVTLSTLVQDLIPIMVETDYPIPVLNETSTLMGIIYPGSVMGKLMVGGD
jgi:glycine betaine/proline transport system ATP-binding protein